MFICNLRVLMAHKKWNIKEAAAHTGLSQPTISKLYNSDPETLATVKLETIGVVCKALGCKLTDLLEYREG